MPRSPLKKVRHSLLEGALAGATPHALCFAASRLFIVIFNSESLHAG